MNSLQNWENSLSIANRNIKIRSLVSNKADWRTKSNGFKEINDLNSKVWKVKQLWIFIR